MSKECHDIGSPAWSAFSDYVPSVPLYQMPHDCESQASATALSRATGVHSVEALENAREVLWSDAGTGIFYANANAAFGCCSVEGHCSLRRRVSECIFNEIEKDLPECGGIGEDP